MASNIHIPRKPGKLVKVTNPSGSWYGFFNSYDKDKQGDLRVRIDAHVPEYPKWSKKGMDGEPYIKDTVIWKVTAIELGTAKMQETYNRLLIEASQWRGDNLF